MRVFSCLAVSLLPLIPASADASFILALESDMDAAATSEVFFVSYPTFADLVADTGGSGMFGGINVAPGFSFGGLAYDGQFRLMLESDADAAANSEAFFVTYPTFGNLVADTNSSGMFGGVNIAPGFSVAGLAFDGQYRLALESDADAAADSEAFFVTYPTFAELVADTGSSGMFGGVNIAPGFSAGGLAYDGQYRLALESDADAAANSEAFFVSYPTFTDLVADTNSSGMFGGVNIAPGFSARGLAWVPDTPPPPAPIPLPAGLPLLLGALGLLALRRRWASRV